MAICQRCRKEVTATIGSFFNTEMICMECESAERHHPEHVAAKEAEHAALQAGDTNFPGIGKPSDL